MMNPRHWEDPGGGGGNPENVLDCFAALAMTDK